MKNIFTAISVLLTLNAAGQELNKKLEDQVYHKQIMIGECSRNGITSFPEFRESYDANYSNYTPDSSAFTQLKDALKGKKITVVLGTWCGDSKLQVPHFLKIIDKVGVNADKVKFVAVDGNKHVFDKSLDTLKIELVPTFIFFDDKGKELGRIVESPKESLEKDMLKIITTKTK